MPWDHGMKQGPASRSAANVSWPVQRIEGRIARTGGDFNAEPAVSLPCRTQKPAPGGGRGRVFQRKSAYFLAMTSISTRPPLGSAPTSTQERAGSTSPWMYSA